MRFWWSLHWGPFGVGDTIWRSKRRQRWYVAKLPGWECKHHHTREDTAEECALRELRRRERKNR
jgi:hypothetical protein